MHEDVTERKRTEEQIIQSQRLETVATLVGGIAHQFNNALFGVIGNVDLLQMSLSGDVNLNKCVEGIKASAHRMAYLVNLLIAYAGRGKYRPEQISLGDFIEDILPLLKRNIDPTISLKTDLSRDIFNINADPTQIQMVLSSVLKNASEATEGEGSIRIITRDEKVDEEFAKSRPGLKPGHYVRLSVEDEGKGMDDETKRKIFEPFFTTKFQGRGLGMSAAYGVVINHDGWISVDSELGRGTTVHIYLPAIKVKIKEEKEPKTEVAMGTGTILLIEDEEIVMDITQGMLERLGYRVLQARNGAEAVNLAKTFDGDIDLAILDIGLPDMGGEKLYPLLKKERPDLRVIICSGYPFEGPVQETLRAGAQIFLEKPYSLPTLAEKLQELLKLKNKQSEILIRRD
jgi:nitrogen-specific signal transduction histidine kinase/ActR/RegA family two-component response regulator